MSLLHYGFLRVLTSFSFAYHPLGLHKWNVLENYADLGSLTADSRVCDPIDASKMSKEILSVLHLIWKKRPLIVVVL
jgi:hypothetical protein